MKESIHNLVKVLEQLEDYLDFTVFYTYEEFLSSHHFCPAFDFERDYYEIQYDSDNDLQILRWVLKSGNYEKGFVLSEIEIKELTSNLVTGWAEKVLKTNKEGIEKINEDNWQHFLKGDIITSEFSEDVIYSIRTEKLSREEIMDRYKIKL